VTGMFHCFKSVCMSALVVSPRCSLPVTCNTLARAEYPHLQVVDRYWSKNAYPIALIHKHKKMTETQANKQMKSMTKDLFQSSVTVIFEQRRSLLHFSDWQNFRMTSSNTWQPKDWATIKQIMKRKLDQRRYELAERQFDGTIRTSRSSRFRPICRDIEDRDFFYKCLFVFREDEQGNPVVYRNLSKYSPMKWWKENYPDKEQRKRVMSIYCMP
jgi:hypothetical protein